MDRSRTRSRLLTLLCVALVLVAFGPLPHAHGDGHDHGHDHGPAGCALCAHGALASLLPDAALVLQPLACISCATDLLADTTPRAWPLYATAPPRGPPVGRV